MVTAASVVLLPALGNGVAEVEDVLVEQAGILVGQQRDLQPLVDDRPIGPDQLNAVCVAGAFAAADGDGRRGRSADPAGEVEVIASEEAEVGGGQRSYPAAGRQRQS